MSVIVEHAPTDGDLAGRVGTTREAVNRVIAQLSRDEVARREGRALHVLDVS